MAAAALSSVDALVNHSAGGDSKKREWTETFGAGDGAGDFGGAQPAGHDSESFVAKKARLEGAPSDSGIVDAGALLGYGGGGGGAADAGGGLGQPGANADALEQQQRLYLQQEQLQQQLMQQQAHGQQAHGQQTHGQQRGSDSEERAKQIELAEQRNELARRQEHEDAQQQQQQQQHAAAAQQQVSQLVSQEPAFHLGDLQKHMIGVRTRCASACRACGSASPC